ncbi:MAG: penicillin-binding protein 1C [Pseudomonadota bacterium]
MRSRVRRLITAGAAGIAVLVLLDLLFPLPAALEAEYARVVVARDGAPLSAFADAKGVWRYPVTLGEVSPNYIEALLHYEDRWFWRHPGVNPLAMLRAFWQNLSSGRIVSGGSTLTMQVARLIDPVERGIGGKLWQLWRALQLEWHYSKEEILTLYLNRAPFGGTVEGVQAACYTYFGKPAAVLSDAEAALLAVLPQAPSRNRPDRYPERAQAMRDKVLKRLGDLQVWPRARVEDALIEPVWAQYYTQPQRAPLLARRLVTANPTQEIYRTTIDAGLQQNIAELIRNRIQVMPPATSAAVLVMENATLAVRAYVGSADIADAQRFGHVDMVQAVRSPGSTLKPFIYGMAIDGGLIHAQSLLVDAPSDFGDYRPENFDSGFSGPVSVTEALQRSLNVPAIQVLERLGDNVFMSRLKSAGVNIVLPEGARANLALGLGGAGVTLESLVGAYSALANQGQAGRPRLLESDEVWQWRMLSEGAAWIIRDILQSNVRPDRPAPYLMDYRGGQVAWKTGTSYGFRDSWAVGATADYTVGVWIGRPDGTPLPGYYGAVAAAPILFTIVDNLPPVVNDDTPHASGYGAPANVTQAEICWPLGGLADETAPEHCHRKRKAYLLDANVPLTFPENDAEWSGNPIVFMVNGKTGKRIDASCSAKTIRQQRVALWPKAVEPWIEARYRRVRQIPDYDAHCKHPPAIATGPVKIAGLRHGSVLRGAGASEELPRIQLQALGGQGRHYWFINGQLRYLLDAAATQAHAFTAPGRYAITVVDEQGRSDEVTVTVE